MFHDIPKPTLARMKYLEEIDTKDRADGTPRLSRLRQIPAETGKFIALLAAGAPAGQYLEIGTSAGYSTLWLALACRLRGRKLTTFEVLEEKAEIALQTFELSGDEDIIDLVRGNALDHLAGYEDVSFCFLDVEKEVYSDCYEAVVPRMVSGGILVADNAISHKTELRLMLDQAQVDDRVDAIVVPVGKGLLVCRKK